MTIKNIVVLGGGAAGWTVANLLRKQLPGGLVNVHLIDDGGKDVMLAEKSGSTIQTFHELIGLDEKTCIAHSESIFCLGTRYKNWSRPLQNYELNDGIYGASLEGVDFQQLFTKSRALNGEHDFDSYSINATAEKLARFGHPVNDPSSIYSHIRYGLNLPLNNYAEVLKRHALNLGVKLSCANCVSVEIDPIDRNIASIKLDNGEVVTPDILINCSDGENNVLETALGVPYSCTDSLELFNEVAVGFRFLNAELRSASVLEHGCHGYIRSIPLRNTEILEYYFSNTHTSRDSIDKEMQNYGVTNIQFNAAGFRRKEEFWVGNCLSIGASAFSFYETYLSSLHIVRNSIVRFLDLLVSFGNLEASRREYNRLSILEYKRLKEFTELNFYTAKNHSAFFKQYFEKNTISPESQHRVDLFGLTGRHPDVEESIVSDAEWAAFFMGNNVIPKTYSVTAEAVDNDRLINFLEKVRLVILKAANHMPFQKNYLEKLNS